MNLLRSGSTSAKDEQLPSNSGTGKKVPTRTLSAFHFEESLSILWFIFGSLRAALRGIRVTLCDLSVEVF